MQESFKSKYLSKTNLMVVLPTMILLFVPTALVILFSLDAIDVVHRNFILTFVSVFYVLSLLISYALSFLIFKKISKTVYDLQKIVTLQKETEKEKDFIQRQLTQSQKLESVGQLAGGMAHDFNNILGAILGYAKRIQKKFGTNPDINRQTEIIIQSARRGSTLTKQLLGFAKGAKTEKNTLNLNECIFETKDLLSQSSQKQINIKLNLHSYLWSVDADSSQVLQILLNIGLNAIDAMKEKGSLTFTTENIFLDASHQHQNKKSNQLPFGKYCLIKISDTGEGISHSIIDKIFDPFFTTKETGKGTGLGLSMAYGIMKNHDGIIDVESELGKGSTFYLYFPTSKNEVLKIENTKMDEENLVELQNKSFLIADDQPTIRDLFKEILEEMGAKVFTASNGFEAVDLYSQNKEKIELIIMDIIMPGINGIEAYKKIEKLNPNICCLFASGYSENKELIHLIQNSNVGYIEKPFNEKMLLKSLNKLLNKSLA